MARFSISMNERIRELADQADIVFGFDKDSNEEVICAPTDIEKFAELIVADYARKTIQGLMSDPAFAQHMDEYYEQKWAHRFD